uniref:Chlorophyll A-B binding protein n=1 Tax=Virus NIOZ-UU159 TaxID=2763270 RepID=A0A7S9SV57_9VIRU|nr:MAG: chlorophyll A-B binding protein [Virus NIOZ-UU159]
MRIRYIVSTILLSLNFTYAFYSHYKIDNAIILKNQPTMSINLNNIKKKTYNKLIRNNKKIPKIVRYFIHHNFSLKESELKHGRIAILAVLGRIFAEVIHPILAIRLYADNLLVNNELVPSFINGGLSRINCIFYILALLYIALIELNHVIEITDISNNKKINISNNFMLKIFNEKKPKEQEKLQIIEINFGRVAMLLSVLFCYYEYTTKMSIINPELLVIYPWFVMFIYILIFT